MRLQRILLLRELGLGLPAIAAVLDGQRDTAVALESHLRLLEAERARLDRRIASVRTTLHKTRNGEPLMPGEALDGFDHTRYQEEVTERWGRDAYRRSDRWWSSLSDAEKREFQQTQLDIAADFGAAARAGLAADSAEVQAVTARHVRWLSAATDVTPAYLTGLGQMYVDDERFGRNYDQHAPGTAALVRDALRVYADRM